MTVSSQTTKLSYNGNDATTVFSFSPLTIFGNDNLLVIHTNAAGSETTITEGTGASNFSVTMDDGYPGVGSITYPADTVTPLPTGESLTIKRQLTLEQQTDLENQGGYNSETQEQQFDKFVMIDLQQQEEVDRGFKFPVSYTGSITVNTNTPAADRYLKINAAGTAMEWATLVDGSLITASSTTPEAVSTTAGSAGASSEYSRGDHVHALTTVVEKNADGGATFTDTDATADVGPEIILDRNSASPAPSDDIGQVSFKGRNDAGTPETIEYASIRANISDETDGTEDGALLFDTIRAGTIAQRMRLDNGVRIGGPDGGDQGAGTLNVEEGLYVDGTGILRGYIDGLRTANNGGDFDHDIGIDIGIVRSDDNTAWIELDSIYIKQLDVPWAVGSAAGGLDEPQLDGAQTVTFNDNGVSPDDVTIDASTWTVTPKAGDTLLVVGGTNAGSYQITGTPTTTVIEVATGSFTADANSTSAIYFISSDDTYHYWMIRRSDTKVSDFLFSRSATAPTLPTNYDQKARIGACITDASANIIRYHQIGDRFYWDVIFQDYDDTNPGELVQTKAVQVPTGIIVEAIHIARADNLASGVNFQILYTSTKQANTAASTSLYTLRVSGNDTQADARLAIETDTSAQIRYRMNNSGASTKITGFTEGWIDPRGKNKGT